MKRFITSLSLLIGIGTLSAQDTWTVSEPAGFGEPWDEYVSCINTFKGEIYAGVADYQGGLYRSTTGSLGTWTPSLVSFPYKKFSDLGVTGEGGGYMYAAIYTFGADSARVMRTSDGSTWTPYFTGYGYEFSHVVPFKGLGASDSIYVIESAMGGSKIYRSGYATNDPNDLSGSWQTVFDFDTVSTYTIVSSVLIHSGRFHIGTNDGQLWGSNDGTNWTRNDSVDFGFGDPGNSEITALEAFGGYIYAGTYNSGGAQLWRTADQLNWTMVRIYPTADKITDLEATGTELWIAARSGNGGGGIIERTSDGSSFTLSNDDGFGQIGNEGDNAVLKVFGNNMYYGVKNYGMGAKASIPASIRGGGGSTGGQIWRTCLIAPPAFSLGNDTAICSSSQITLDAGPALTYFWSGTSATTQTLSVGPGTYSCQITAASGCDASDAIVISGITSPAITMTTPLPSTDTYVCLGDSLAFDVSANSGLYILDPATPYNRITRDTICDILGDNFDTLSVAGVPGSCACTSLISVTIDSIEHTYTGDIVMGLYSPSGAYTQLVTFGYGSSFDDGYMGTEFSMNTSNTLGGASPPFTGTFLPDGDFSTLFGSPNGNWVLKVGDIYGGDEGNLLGWTLKFGYADTLMTVSWTPSGGLSSTTIFNPVCTPTATTDYVISVTSSNGCTSYDTASIVVPEIQVPATATVCYGGSTTINATGGSAYNWFPATALDVTSGPSVITSATSNTLYYVADTIAGCPVIDSIYVIANPQLFAIASTPVTICYGDSTLISSAPAGGTAPYSWNWNDGSTNFPGQTVMVSPLTGTSYTLTVTDSYGCSATDNTGVGITPSTDVTGHVSYSGGNVTNGNVVAFRYYPMLTKFDSIQTTSLNTAGDYTFTSLNSGNYLIKVFPDTLVYPTLNSTYYGNEFAWDSATVLNHGCSLIDTANIVMVEETGFVGGGLGFLRGRITEDIGFGRTPGDPIPGLDVKLGKNPGGAMVTSTVTNSTGYYSFSAVDFNTTGQEYVVYVDIPGLGIDSSYTFRVDATTPTYLYLDYVVDSTMIHFVPNAGTGVSNPAVVIENRFSIFPNPAQDVASLEYTLERDADVSVAIYDVLGVKLLEPVSGRQTKGLHRYTISAETEHLSSGVYFISFIVDGRTSIQRLVITK